MSDTSDAPTPVWWSQTEGSPISMVWLPDGTVVSASPSCAALLGTTVTDIVGKRWPELIAPGDAEVTTLAFGQLDAGVSLVDDDGVYAVDAFDLYAGRRRVIRWYEWATRDDSGAVVEIRSVAIDVSEIYESREALAEHVERLSQERSQERQRVAQLLHDGALQQMVAARWLLMEGGPSPATALLDEALLVVRSSVEVLDQSDRPTFSTDPDPDEQVHESPVAYDLGRPSDALMVFSAAGTIWESDSCGSVFGATPRSTIRDLARSAHPNDCDALRAAALAALAGDSARVIWRFRHPETGEQLLLSDAYPLPDQDDAKRALLSTRDVVELIDVDLADELRVSSRAAERAHMARVLHDDVQQRVSALKWMTNSEVVDERISDAIDSLDRALRSATRRLASDAFHLGMAGALRAEAARMRTPTTVRCEVDALPPELADAVFHSVREALRNVDEHASATRADLDMYVADGHVWVEIVDDGVGVLPSRLVKAALSGHLGVVSMRESAHQLGGRFEITSGAQGGTIVRFHVPLESPPA